MSGYWYNVCCYTNGRMNAAACSVSNSLTFKGGLAYD